MPTPRPTEVVLRRRRSVRYRRGMRRVSGWLDPVRRNAAGAALALLVVAVTLVGLAQYQWSDLLPPLSLYAPFVVLGGLFLRPLAATAFFVYITAWMVVGLVRSNTTSRMALIELACQLIVMGFMVWISRSRGRLGVTGISGESMFVDLRDRLRRGGVLPPLPWGWYAEAALNSAYGNSFSGDFMLTALSTDGKQLEVAVVDVSGKGSAAGTRALLLSGAFGGLLGSVRPEEFLQAANAYLLRQQWEEGFATCVHLAIDLVTGEYTLGCAGHPPAAQYLAGSGRWVVLDDTRGPLLGVLEAPEFGRHQGQVRRGEAVLLYTDGVVESRRRDFDDGVDRMLGVAASKKGFRGLAQAICRAARSGDGDDRAVVLVAWE